MILRFSVLLITLTSVVLSQDLPPRTIVVRGYAERSFIADKATFTFAILGLGSTLRAAVDDAKSKTETVTSALRSIGLSQEALETEEFVSGENYDKAFLSSSRDFRASLRTLVSVDSLDLVEPAILVLSDKKPENISSVTFLLSDREKRVRETLLGAVEDARLQASAIAEALGVTLKEPYFVDAEATSEVPVPQPLYRLRAGRSAEVAMTIDGTPERSFISAKKILLTSAVRVVFQY